MDLLVGPCAERSARVATHRSATATATGRTCSRSSWTTSARASTWSSAAVTCWPRRRTQIRLARLLGREHRRLRPSSARSTARRLEAVEGRRRHRCPRPACGGPHRGRSGRHGGRGDRLRAIRISAGPVADRRSAERPVRPARSGPPSPRRGRGHARRSAGPRSAAATSGRRSASHPTGGAGSRASTPQRLDRRAIVPARLRYTEAHLRGVVPLGLDDMADHLVAIAATATWSLAQLRGRAGGHPVEDRPGRLDDPRQAFGLVGRDRAAIERGDGGRDAERGPATAVGLLDDVVDRRDRTARRPRPRRRRSDGIRRERLECELFRLARARPAGPVDRGREDLLGRRLEETRIWLPALSPGDISVGGQPAGRADSRGRRPRWSRPSRSRPRQSRRSERGRQGVAIEPEMVDPLGLGGVERAVLGVEVGEREVSARPQQPGDGRQRGAVSSRWWRTSNDTTRSNGSPGGGSSRSNLTADIGRATGGQLLGDDLVHPGRRLGEDDLADMGRQGDAEKPGAGPDIDDASVRRDAYGIADGRGHDLRALLPLGRVPVARPLVERAHRAPDSGARWPPGARRPAGREPAMSRPSGPSASTSADPTTTPSAPAAAIAWTWTGRLTPKPTATGTGDAASRRGRGGRRARKDVRAPVTPTRDTQ